MPEEPTIVHRVMQEFWSDGSMTWKPAGAAKTGGARTAEDDWVNGPECPIHGAWAVVPLKDGSGYFYSCKVERGEDWCKKKVSTREGSWGKANPPRPEEDNIYTSDEDLFGA